MLIKSLYAGLVGGLAIAAAFYYPLYVYLPGRYVNNWQDGSQPLAFALAGVGGLLAIATGAAASRLSAARSRGHGALVGALAGGTAGLLLFSLLGAAAAGTVGMQDIFAHGSRPASDETQFMTLLVDAVINITYLTYAALWSILLGGSVLGALGGVLMPASGSPRSDDQQRIALQLGSPMAIAAFLSAILSLIVAIAIFKILPDTVDKSVQEYGLTPPLPTSGLFNLPVGTMWLFYLASLVWATYLMRGASSGIMLSSGSKDAEKHATLTQLQASAYVIGVISILAAGFILLMTGGNPGILSLLGCLLSVAAGVWHLLIARKLGAEKKQLAIEPASRMPWWYIAVLVGFPALTLVFVGLTNISLPLPPFVTFLLWLAIYIGLVVWLGRKLPAGSPSPQAGSIMNAQAKFLRDHVLAVGIGSGAAMIIVALYNGVVQTGLNLTLGPVVAISMLASYDQEIPATPFSAAEITQSYYNIHASATGYSLLVAIGGTLLSVLVASVIMKLVAKRVVAQTENVPLSETTN